MGTISRSLNRPADERFLIKAIERVRLSGPGNFLLSVVEDGTGHCLTAYVISYRRGISRVIWNSPYRQTNDYCAESAVGEAVAKAVDGNVQIKMPVRTWGQKGTPRVVLHVVTYRWNGTTYSKLRAVNYRAFHHVDIDDYAIER